VTGIYLVTGATGFIGRRLCKSLQANGEHVRALLRGPCEGDWAESVISELGTGIIPVAALKGVQTVFHLAGKAHALTETRQEESEYFRINTDGTRRLLEAAKAAGVRRFVFFSSVKAMGEGTESEAPLDESAACHPETPYGKSKLAAEQLVLEGGYVPEPVVLRLSMVYGPTHKGNLSRMIEAIRKGRFPPMPEFGNKRSMVHVDDVVEAAWLAAEKPEAVGQVYIVTDGRACSTRQMYEWICEALRKDVPAWRIPVPALKGLAKVGDGIGRVRGRRFIFDSDALEKLAGSAWYSNVKISCELKWHPRQTLADTLPEIVAAILCHG